jgi:hypothetical protein
MVEQDIGRLLNGRLMIARSCKGKTGLIEDLRLFIVRPVCSGNYARKGRRKMGSDSSTIIRQQRARSIMKHLRDNFLQSPSHYCLVLCSLTFHLNVNNLCSRYVIIQLTVQLSSKFMCVRCFVLHAW